MIESDWFLTAHIYSLILKSNLSDYQELATSSKGAYWRLGPTFKAREKRPGDEVEELVIGQLKNQ